MISYSDHLVLLFIGCMPQRYIVAILCFLGLTVSYVMRFCLSLAMIEMSEAPKIKEDPNACPYPEGFEFANSTRVSGIIEL